MTQNIRDLYIFEWLTEKEIDYFLLMTETREYKANAVIMKEGDASDGNAYFIESGSVIVERKGKWIAELEVWGFFGEFALITHETRTATVHTHEPTVLRIFRHDEFKILLDRSKSWPSIRDEIMRRIRENTEADWGKNFKKI